MVLNSDGLIDGSFVSYSDRAFDSSGNRVIDLSGETAAANTAGAENATQYIDHTMFIDVPADAAENSMNGTLTFAYDLATAITEAEAPGATISLWISPVTGTYAGNNEKPDWGGTYVMLDEISLSDLTVGTDQTASINVSFGANLPNFYGLDFRGQRVALTLEMWAYGVDLSAKGFQYRNRAVGANEDRAALYTAAYNKTTFATESEVSSQTEAPDFRFTMKTKAGVEGIAPKDGSGDLDFNLRTMGLEIDRDKDINLIAGVLIDSGTDADLILQNDQVVNEKQDIAITFGLPKNAKSLAGDFSFKYRLASGATPSGNLEIRLKRAEQSYGFGSDGGIGLLLGTVDTSTLNNDGAWHVHTTTLTMPGNGIYDLNDMRGEFVSLHVCPEAGDGIKLSDGLEIPMTNLGSFYGRNHNYDCVGVELAKYTDNLSTKNSSGYKKHGNPETPNAFGTDYVPQFKFKISTGNTGALLAGVGTIKRNHYGFNSIDTEAINANAITTAKIDTYAVDNFKMRLRNNFFFVGRDQADSGNIDIIKVDTSNQLVLGDKLNDPSNVAPTLDTQLANKKYVDDQVAGAIAGGAAYVGGYDASGDPNALSNKGDMYTVTVGGTGVASFWSTPLEIGDMIIAEQDNPATEDHWTVVQKNLDAATETSQGYIQLATLAEVDGGTEATKAITPAALEASKYVASGDASTVLDHAQTTPADWTVADGSAVGAHLDELADRLTDAESLSLDAANKTLSNLTTPTDVNEDLLTTTNKNIGSNAKRFRRIRSDVFIQAGVDDTDAVQIEQGFNSPNYTTVNGVKGTGSRTLSMYTENKSSTTPSSRVAIESGDTVDGKSGDVVLYTGRPSGTGNSGNVQLIAGIPTGTGSRGLIQLSADANDARLVNQPDGTNDLAIATVGYTDSAIDAALVGGMTYQGSIDCSTIGTQLDGASKGDFFIVSVGGTVDGSTYSIGDHLVVNADITTFVDNQGDLDIIDNTEASDIIRTSDIIDDLVTGGTQDALSAEQGKTLKGLVDDLQVEVDAIETGVGLATDGTYITVSGSNYLDTSTSVVSALDLLDQAIDALDIVVGGITDATGSINTHSDVDTLTAAPNSGDVLKWNGSNWVPSSDIDTTDTHKKVKIVLDGTDILNQYVDLGFVAELDSIKGFVGRLAIHEDSAAGANGDDYTVSYTGGASSDTRITFQNSIATAGAEALVAGDVLYFYFVEQA
jgi:hypothetical protein